MSISVHIMVDKLLNILALAKILKKLKRLSKSAWF